MDVPYFFWKAPEGQEPKHAEEVSVQEVSAHKTAQREVKFTKIASIIIALLSLATAVVKLASEIIP